MRLRSATGIIVGGIVDILATNLLTFPLMVYAAIAHDLTRLPSDKVGPALVAALQGSPSLQLVAWGLGLVATTLGGYVAAVIGREAPVRLGALSAWLCMGLGIYSLVAPEYTVPMWQHVLAFVLSPAFGAVGGHLRQRRTFAQDDRRSAAVSA